MMNIGDISTGISTFSLLLESIRLATLWAYNYCFGYSLFTYLEYPFLLLQQTVLFHLVAKYRNSRTLETSAINLIIFSSILLFANDVLPKWILSYLLACYSFFMNICFHLQSTNFNNFFSAILNLSRLHAQQWLLPVDSRN